MVNLLGADCQISLAKASGKSAYIGGMKQATTKKRIATKPTETTLADRLETLLGLNPGLTRAGLAARVGVTRQAAYYWFNGKTRAIDSEAAFKIAEKFGVRAAWLQTGHGAMYASPELTDEEKQIIAFYKRMNDQDKNVLMKMARGLAADSDGKRSVGDPFGLPPPR